ncbi:hypothetical protein SAMN05892877_101447 [Rhizobium subbaraonis]|uniref:Uncharacterized protein n=1 Tax=Rhizobium subbaraonis TaxID=908946 RepID=A0A285U0Y4_9HYPH|nr:hypothetical protein [Rhizobium subbaraonis]SOC35620.1 hypothetical protein SAMN05892877_101447 [Rhizobium subbaraonis]
MRSLLLTLSAGALSASIATAAEPMIFHTANFGGDTVVSLGLIGYRLSNQAEYDYDVLISLSQKHFKSGDVYSDPGRHRAFVRCSDPAKVSVRGVDYAVSTSLARGTDWKSDLWVAVCRPSVS